MECLGAGGALLLIGIFVVVILGLSAFIAGGREDDHNARMWRELNERRALEADEWFQGWKQRYEGRLEE